jgi:hypothetical protein
MILFSEENIFGYSHDEAERSNLSLYQSNPRSARYFTESGLRHNMISAGIHIKKFSSYEY